MTQDELKKLLDNPPLWMSKLAFQYRQSFAARQQAEQKLGAAQQQLNGAVSELNRARGYETAMLDAINAVVGTDGPNGIKTRATPDNGVERDGSQ